MNSDTPLVSVIIPVFNGEKHLERAAHSVLVQDHARLELIIVDDGSVDQSLNLATMIKTSDHRVSVISQQNRGVSAARNTGTLESSGDFVAFLDADDWWEPDTLSTLVKMATQRSAACVRFNLYIHNHGRSTHRKTSLDGPNNLLDTAAIKEYISLLVSGKEPGYACTLLLNGDVARSTLFNESIRIFEDLDYTIRIVSQLSTLVLTDRALLHYDLSEPSATREPGDAALMVREAIKGHLAVDETLIEVFSGAPKDAQSQLSARSLFITEYLATTAVLHHIGTRTLENLIDPLLRATPEPLPAHRVSSCAKPRLPSISVLKSKGWTARKIAVYLKAVGYFYHTRDLARAATRRGLRSICDKRDRFVRLRSLSS